MYTGIGRSDGFIVEQLLLTLITCTFLIPVTVAVIRIMFFSLERPADIQDELAISQIRHIINVSSDFSAEGSSLYFTYHGRFSSFSLINGKLILKPGTQIFLSELDDAFFRIEDEIIIVSFSHPEQPVTEHVIGHV